MKSFEALSTFTRVYISHIIEFYFGASHKIRFSNFKLRNCDTSLSFCDPLLSLGLERNG